MVCPICKNETACRSVCRTCRSLFKHLANSDLFLYCINCDTKGFPCTGCAKNIFEGKLDMPVLDAARDRSTCHICNQVEDEGTVCQSCREIFLDMADISRYDYDDFLTCENCDYYGFPCLICAKNIFDGQLGPGNGIILDLPIVGYKVADLLDILYKANSSTEENTENMNKKDECCIQ